ncbi:MAG: kinase [Xanthomonadales bacterium]|jgi:D-glycerate 3-kinase|nr:kinase [Xanthomonadales bacterium]
MGEECNARAADWLERHTDWSAPERSAVAGLAPTLVELLPRRRPWLLGIGGAPGTGKSTLARLLAYLSVPPAGGPHLAPRVLSLDDYYLTRTERMRLTETVHPLLGQRGVPGTHDVDRLFRDLDALLHGSAPRVETPRFDKGADDRLPEGRMVETGLRPGAVILEGWFVGLAPQSDQALKDHVSPFERVEDEDGRWRRHVNGELARFDRRFSRRHPVRWMLCPPDWPTVAEWRWRQEQELAPDRRLLDGPEAVNGFLQPFERLVRHQLATASRTADLVLWLDRHHHPHLQSRP